MTLALIAPGHWLAPEPAAAYRAMIADGCPVGITSSTRTVAEQWYLYDHQDEPGYASATTPAKSKHVYRPGAVNEGGRALDLPAAAAAWVRRYGAAYGWIADLVKGEWWHFEFTARTPAPAQEDDMPLNAADATLINAVVISVLRSTEAKGIIRDAVLNGEVSDDTGTLAQTVRDARVIARRTEVAVLALAAQPEGQAR